MQSWNCFSLFIFWFIFEHFGQKGPLEKPTAKTAVTRNKPFEWRMFGALSIFLMHWLSKRRHTINP